MGIRGRCKKHNGEPYDEIWCCPICLDEDHQEDISTALARQREGIAEMVEKLNKAVKLLVKINSKCRGAAPYEGDELGKMISGLLTEVNMPIKGYWEYPKAIRAYAGEGEESP